MHQHGLQWNIRDITLCGDGVTGGTFKKICIIHLSFFGLLAVGIFKLTEYAIRKYIERHKFLCKKVKISFSQLSFILSIYNNPVMADRDHSATMSCVEAVFFALAMSLDGMFGGLGAGFTGKNIFFTVMGSFVCQFLCRTLRMQDWHAGI